MQAYELIAEIFVVDSFAFFRILSHFPIPLNLAGNCAHGLYMVKRPSRPHSSALLVPAL